MPWNSNKDSSTLAVNLYSKMTNLFTLFCFQIPPPLLKEINFLASIVLQLANGICNDYVLVCYGNAL